MMVGMTSAYMAWTLHGHPPGFIGSEAKVEDDQENGDDQSDGDTDDEGDDNEEDDNVGPVSGPRALSSVTLTS